MWRLALVGLLAACGGNPPAAEPPAIGNSGAAPPDAAPAPAPDGASELDVAIGTIRRRVQQVDVNIGGNSGDSRPVELCIRVLPVGPSGAPLQDDVAGGVYSTTGDPCTCALGDDGWAHGDRMRFGCVECTCEAGVARRCESACGP